MSSEIDKGCPKWTWIHKNLPRHVAALIWSMILLLMGAWIASSLYGVGLGDGLEEAPPELREPIAWTTVPIFAFAVIPSLIIFIWNKCFYWFFPPIEIHGDGQDSTTIRRISLLISPFATVILGVVVNIIS
jgi:hypothetical protein